MKLTLKQWRMVRNLSRKQVASMISKGESTIRNWEEGKTEPTASDIRELETALNISWSDVILVS